MSDIDDREPNAETLPKVTFTAEELHRFTPCDPEEGAGCQICAKEERERLARVPLSNQVREFHTAFGVPMRDTPGVPDDETVRLRLRLMDEFCELLDATYSDDNHEAADWIADIRHAFDGLITDCRVSVDLVKFVDALADLDYVIEGTRLAFGIDGGPIAAEVHRSNMSKLGADGKPVLRPDGKITKGPNYSPPNIERELVAQGWVKP